MTCPNRHTSRVLDALAGEAPRSEMYAKLVLGFNGEKRYEPITEFDRSLYAECSGLLQEPELVLPLGELDHGENTCQAIRWGFTRWRQFFNDRQLYSLGLLASAIRDLSVGAAEREALAALFSGTLEFNNMFCSFKGEGTGALSATCSAITSSSPSGRRWKPTHGARQRPPARSRRCSRAVCCVPRCTSSRPLTSS